MDKGQTGKKTYESGWFTEEEWDQMLEDSALPGYVELAPLLEVEEE